MDLWGEPPDPPSMQRFMKILVIRVPAPSGQFDSVFCAANVIYSYLAAF